MFSLAPLRDRIPLIISIKFINSKNHANLLINTLLEEANEEEKILFISILNKCLSF
jgi:hypothetical protein